MAQTQTEEPRAFTVSASDIGACPDSSMRPAHYRDGGECAHAGDADETFDDCCWIDAPCEAHRSMPAVEPSPMSMTISISRKVNTGNYESAEVFLSLQGVREDTTREQMEAMLENGKVGYDVLRERLAAEAAVMRGQWERDYADRVS